MRANTTCKSTLNVHAETSNSAAHAKTPSHSQREVFETAVVRRAIGSLTALKVMCKNNVMAIMLRDHFAVRAQTTNSVQFFFTSHFGSFRVAHSTNGLPHTTAAPCPFTFTSFSKNRAPRTATHETSSARGMT
jgi:hypothetical protein